MRRTHGVALAARSAAIAVAVAVAVPAIGANGNDKGLSKHDRALLAEARPGDTALTRIRCGPSSAARPRVSATIAAFEEL